MSMVPVPRRLTVSSLRKRFTVITRARIDTSLCTTS